LPFALVVLTGCQATAATPGGSTGPSPTPPALTSPSSSATPGGAPVVVVLNQADQAHYTITLVGVDGRSVAAATAAYGDEEPVPFPGSAAGGSPPNLDLRGPE
jgi:hypothetical protein